MGLAGLVDVIVFHQLLAWGGILAGFGGFNLFDGVVDHKLLRQHQIRRAWRTCWPTTRPGSGCRC
jgi:uncharacterized membrane protein